MTDRHDPGCNCYDCWETRERARQTENDPKETA
jgi:hypothetical protein